ncbi:SufS family cysteine desulfurase [Candidatus Colwellia aromaticivorans]|uniref:SufS family cysteine desulfurase n=1 Tax=Candidatus Colwellia aromaticivorans TaxID=2267621 RepID=UPI000DF2A46B|nr:SufS family cysteine desulfurase [Candidatus Colwellia aromaticivorans]
MKKFKPALFRQQFPLVVNYEGNTLSINNSLSQIESSSPLVYFDNGATTQKPNCVIDSYHSFYQTANANVHRSSHALSAKATTAFEHARKRVKTFINAKSYKEIIWTKGTTESINLIAMSFGRKILKQGDEVILALSEHHANIVPWQLIAEQTGAVIKIAELDVMGRVDLPAFERLLNSKTKVFCCAHLSNVIGKINPISELIQMAKSVGAITVIDGAQAVVHFPIDVQSIDCDFYVFSAHKMYGPTGVGVLYGKQALLETMPPYQGGGEMIKQVSFNSPTTFNSLPFKFEAGTPNIAGVIAFGKAIEFISAYNAKQIREYEKQLTIHCYQALQNLSVSSKKIVTFTVQGLPDIPVICFTLSGHHNHDIATALDSYGIAIRSGHHCAMPLMEYLNISGCLRVSLAAYNTFEEINYFINCLKKILAQESDSSLACANNNGKNEKNEQASSLVITQFAAVKSWDARHRQIMLLGKQLNRLDKSARNEQTLISGCESLAWLVTQKNRHNIFHFQADSDAKIIRGLLFIVLAAFNDKTAEQIQAFDIESYFNTLGLIQHLSPSRGNGILAIVDKIKGMAQ